MTKTDTKHFGYIAIIGHPNSGKSTLINALVGTKVSIVSAKPQTTRFSLLGVWHDDKDQMIFIDTPGLLAQPKDKLNKLIAQSAWQAFDQADVFIVLIDADSPRSCNDLFYLDKLKETGKPLVLVINKVDLVAKSKLLPLMAELQKKADFESTFLISAKNGNGVIDLQKHLCGLLPHPGWAFDEDYLTNLSEKLFAAEITREQVFRLLHEELPYAIYVETTHWEVFDNGSIKIHQDIYVERDSQKSIVLGKKGQMIKTIGERARQVLGETLGVKVHLFLFVKVKKDWVNDPLLYKDMGDL